MFLDGCMKEGIIHCQVILRPTDIPLLRYYQTQHLNYSDYLPNGYLESGCFYLGKKNCFTLSAEEYFLLSKQVFDFENTTFPF